MGYLKYTPFCKSCQDFSMSKRARREEYVRLPGHMPAEKTGAQGRIRARVRHRGESAREGGTGESPRPAVYAQRGVCARRSMHGD